jgi:hypothetical protein
MAVFLHVICLRTKPLNCQGWQAHKRQICPMKQILPIFYSLLFLFGASTVYAQNTNTAYPFKVAQDRMLWHDNVDKQQRQLLALDGKADDSFRVSKDDNINLQVADVMIRQVDDLQEQIEQDSTLTGQGKIKYLRSVESMLRGFNTHFRKRDFPITLAPGLFIAFKDAMYLDRNNLSIEPVIQESSYGIGAILVDCFLLPSENRGVRASRILLWRKYCELHPEEILSVLSAHPELPFADSLIIVAGHRDIRKLYDFAAPHNALAYRIRSSHDSLVNTVARMANSKSGQLYFPFLDNLIRNKITIEEINKVKDNPLNYYRLLVKTRMDYASRLLPPANDTALEMRALTNMLENKGKDIFVREINALHTAANPAVRFKILEPLTPEELYYLIVLSEDEIYTSSYLGVYERIFQRMKNARGDSLIMRLHGDYFRKFRCR